MTPDEAPLKLERVSSAIFAAGEDHTIRYDKTEFYLECDCHSFTYNSKCVYADSARKILEEEGKQVKYRRKPRPVFLDEPERFKEQLSAMFERLGMTMYDGKDSLR